MSNKVKIQCGGFYLGDGLTMDGNTLKSSGGEQVQADWNQNNSAAADYVKNRTHYSVQNLKPILEDKTFVYNSSLNNYYILLDSTLSIQKNYMMSVNGGSLTNVSFDGKEFVCGEYSFTYVGPSEISNPRLTISISSVQNVSLYEFTGEEVHQLDKKFIPDSVKHMYVNITLNEEDGTYAADKTFAEISEHINNGGTVSAIFMGYIFNMAGIGPEVILFRNSYGSDMFISYIINASNVVSIDIDYFVSSEQGPENSGKFLMVGDDGIVAPSDLILPSSTTDSTKKFKITVDDSGTISATEVTA